MAERRKESHESAGERQRHARKDSSEERDSDSEQDTWPKLMVTISTKLVLKKDIPPVPEKPKPNTAEKKQLDDHNDAEEAEEAEGKVPINFEKEEPLGYSSKINPELRNVFFEQDKEKNCIVVANEESLTYKDRGFSEFYSRVIRKNICRKFLVELRKRMAKAQKTDYAREYDQFYVRFQHLIRDDSIRYNSVYIHDFIRQQITDFILFKLISSCTLNDRWQLVQCLLDICPIVEDGPALPVFSVEPVGRDGWTLTTYGEHPQQQQLFPGVPLTITTDEELVYTATFERSNTKRRLCMLDQS